MLSAADEDAALHGDGWYMGTGIDDCDTTCAAAGLLCSEDKLLEHNRDLASQEQARIVLGATVDAHLGGATLRTAFGRRNESRKLASPWVYTDDHNQHLREQTALSSAAAGAGAQWTVTNYHTDELGLRDVRGYSCSHRGPGPGLHRLCWCWSALVSSTASPTMAGHAVASAVAVGENEMQILHVDTTRSAEVARALRMSLATASNASHRLNLMLLDVPEVQEQEVFDPRADDDSATTTRHRVVVTLEAKGLLDEFDEKRRQLVAAHIAREAGVKPHHVLVSAAPAGGSDCQSRLQYCADGVTLTAMIEKF